MDNRRDVMDLKELAAALRRGLPWILGGGLLGLGLGALTLVTLDRQYEASATVLLRSQAGGSSSALALSRISGMLGGLGGGGLGGSEVETEQQILTSRAVLGEVVDSLGLQVRVTEPSGARADEVFSSYRIAPDAAGGEFSFERREGSWAVEGEDFSATVAPGGSLRVPGGVLVLRRSGLPDKFEVAVSDRQGAVLAVEKSLSAEVTGGEVVGISFRAGDPRLAAEVPNAMIARYLARRRTTDRGVNQHRYEFLTAHTDSIASQLAAAESALRRHQEASGVLDPELSGKTELERAMTIQAELETAEIEARSLQRIVARGGSGGGFSPRELAAFPTFLNNPAINDVLSRLLKLETDRIVLLERRTERDPEVMALSSSIEHLEGQLVALSRDYLAGLNSRQSELRRELGGYRSTLAALPAQAEQSLRREREVRRLSETLIAMQTQLVEARLGAIGEGGEVRQVDVAVPPRKPAFPNPPLNLLGGLLGGLFFGTVAAVAASLARGEVREPWEAELATGAPAVGMEPGLPLWLAGIGEARSALVVPAGRSADALAVAEQLVATAALRGREAMAADLTQPVTVAPPRLAATVPAARVAETGGVATLEGRPGPQANGNGASAGGMRSALGDLEARYGFVAAALPGIEGPQTVAVLAPERPVVVVARAGRVHRDALRRTVEACERLGVPVAGVVLQPAAKRGRKS
ncbi:MAG: Wzz/FepE/Etk N-terminal domain-containing protein [Gemmatimonadota bacterium]